MTGNLPSPTGRNTSARNVTPSSISIGTSQPICMPSRSSDIVPVMTAIALLPPSRRAGEALGLLGRAEQRLRLIDALLLLEFGVGIGNDAGAGLDIHDAVLDQRGA